MKTGLEVTDPKCVCVCQGLICLLYNYSLACVVASLFMNVDDCAGEGENDMVVLAADRQAAIQRQKEEAKKRRRKKKRTGSSLFASTFNGKNLLKNLFSVSLLCETGSNLNLNFSILELYRLTGEFLGQGAYASVQTCVNIWTDVEYAVKVIYFFIFSTRFTHLKQENWLLTPLSLTHSNNPEKVKVQNLNSLLVCCPFTDNRKSAGP